MLEVLNLVVKYDSVTALKGVSLRVREGQIVSIIGANGAGKSTLLKTISGFVPKSGGQVLFQGKSLPEYPHEVVKLGVVHVPEGRRVFPGLTVEENLLAGALTVKERAPVLSTLEQVYSIFPRLKERRKQLAGTLSGGEQQMLAIGRGLMSRPRLLMIDEPSLGLAPILVSAVIKCIRSLNQRGLTVLLVEQNANKALEISTYAYVLENGRIALEGPGPELLRNPKVRHAYLGEKPGGGIEIET